MIDLHTHSTCSDGSETPEQLVDHALALGLKAMALTDHDTVAGIPEFLKAAEGTGMEAVPGIEMSSLWLSKELHIVGLFIDPENQELRSVLEENRINRDARNAAIVEKLRRLGYAINMEDVLSVAGGESVGRPHIARVLVNKGYFERVQQVFDHLLRRGRSAFVQRKLPHPDDVIRVIRSAGGVAIWAHPVSGLESGERPFVRKMLKAMLPAGLDGIETFYTSFNPRQTELLTELAAMNNLLRSGGSDYHGLNQPSVHLGTGGGMLSVPDELLGPIRERAAERRKQ